MESVLFINEFSEVYGLQSAIWVRTFVTPMLPNRTVTHVEVCYKCVDMLTSTHLFTCQICCTFSLQSMFNDRIATIRTVCTDQLIRLILPCLTDIKSRLSHTSLLVFSPYQYF